MIRIENIKIYEDLNEEELLLKICKKNRINKEDVINMYIFKKSIDARDKANIAYIYTIDLDIKNENNFVKFKKIDKEKINTFEMINVKRQSNFSPVIIGAGPAGLFAAYTLIQKGIKPIILEQGKKVEDRIKDVEVFFQNGKLNTLSNIQFGEGGAGTFSDGKLTTGIKNPLCLEVLDIFIKFGAPKQIKYMSKPHIGTDKLVDIIANMRKYIISNGGEIRFNNKVTDIIIEENKISKVICNQEIQTDTVILACRT